MAQYLTTIQFNGIPLNNLSGGFEKMEIEMKTDFFPGRNHIFAEIGITHKTITLKKYTVVDVKKSKIVKVKEF